MIDRKDKISLLEALLRRAYHQRDTLTVNDRWKTAVMRRVAAIGPHQHQTEFSMRFGQFVWRLAPTACALIVVSAALLVGFDFTPQNNILTSLFMNPEELGLAQFFQI